MTNPVATSTPAPELLWCKTISRMLMRPEFSGEMDVEKDKVKLEPLVVPGSRKITKTTQVKPRIEASTWKRPQETHWGQCENQYFKWTDTHQMC